MRKRARRGFTMNDTSKKTGKLQNAFRCLIRGSTWIYFLRVPLLVAAVMFVLGWNASTKGNITELVRGAFDLAGDRPGPWTYVYAVCLGLTLGTLVCSLQLTSWLTLSRGKRRFHLTKEYQDPSKAMHHLLWVFYLLLALPSVIACHSIIQDQASAHPWMPLLATALLVGSIVLAIFAHFFLIAHVAKISTLPIVRVFANTALPLFVTRPSTDAATQSATDDATLRDEEEYNSERRALIYGFVAFVFYLICWLIPSREMPAAVYVLLLLLVICLFLGALTFLLDRYRIPVISVPVVLLLVNAYVCPWKDYQFDVADGAALPKAADILNPAGKRQAVASHPICVAAVGGGVHSGSWAVEVLTRLEDLVKQNQGQTIAEGTGTLNRFFAPHVAAVSGTSGGSYGLMYFAANYNGDTGVFDDSALENMRSTVQRSSLGPVIHGLVYHDIWHDFVPLAELGDKAVDAISPSGINGDRGRRLEKAWTQKLDKSGKDPVFKKTLADWGKDAAEGHRPVVLFNSMAAESGRPVVFGSSPVKDWNFSAKRGVLDPYLRQSPPLTVSVATGARLSASFPYVAPTAQPSDPEGIFHRKYPDVVFEHHVDGGFYDNYGLVSLTQWVQEGLSALYPEVTPAEAKANETSPVGRLLVVQIRYRESIDAPAAVCATPPPSPSRPGPLYQIVAPPMALATVRSTAQRLRNNDELDTFTHYWLVRRVKIDVARFEFPGEAPLSWHLTKADKDALTEQGQEIASQYNDYRRQSAEIDKLPDKERADKLDALAAQYPLGASAAVVMRFLSE